MSLSVRIINLEIEDQFKVEYRKSGTTSYSLVGTYVPNTDSVLITNLEFNTLYEIKITNLFNNSYQITSVFTNDSKCFNCYDNIDFYVDVNDDQPCTGKTVTIYDLVSGQTGYGNHSSVINNVPRSYRMYTGLTHNITGSTFVGIVTTNPTTGEIYQFQNFRPLNRPVYVFLEHGDGSVENETLTDPKKQGGFQVRVIFISCPICFTYRCSGTENTTTILNPAGIYNGKGFYRICCNDYVVFWSTNNRWEVRSDFNDPTLISVLNCGGDFPIVNSSACIWSSSTLNNGAIFYSNFECCPDCDAQVVDDPTCTTCLCPENMTSPTGWRWYMYEDGYNNTSYPDGQYDPVTKTLIGLPPFLDIGSSYQYEGFMQLYVCNCAEINPINLTNTWGETGLVDCYLVHEWVTLRDQPRMTFPSNQLISLPTTKDAPNPSPAIWVSPPVAVLNPNAASQPFPGNTITGGTVSTINCAGRTIFGTVTAGVTYTPANAITVTIPVTNGNRGGESKVCHLSTGVTGLKLCREAGANSFSPIPLGDGVVSYYISGTASSPGTANFNVVIGQVFCTVSIPVS